MSERSITIIFGYRDREIDRVKRSLESLVIQTRDDFYVNFVDYGSRPHNARCVQELAEAFEFCSYFYSDTRGHPWNRARALNIGIRRCKTEIVLTTDVDMIFAPNFVEEVLNAQDGHSVVHCAPHWIPEGFTNWTALTHSQDKFPVGDRAQRGGCQCMPYNILVEIGGFDEAYEYWGAEDRDLHKRLLKSGLSELWVDKATSIYHQWHPIDHANAPRGYGQRWAEPYLKRVEGEISRNDSNWGSIIRREERQIYALLPETDLGTIVDWRTLLIQLAEAASVVQESQRWILTDCATFPFSTDATLTGYQHVIIDGPSSSYLLHEDGEKESEIEHHFANAISDSARSQPLPPEVIIIYIPTFWRLSRNLFQSLINVLAPGGLLAVANLHQSHLPLSWRCWRVMLPTVLEWLCPRLWRVSPQASRQCRDMLAALRAPNDLRDSLYLSRVGVPGITDFALDFPIMGGTAVFLKRL